MTLLAPHRIRNYPRVVLVVVWAAIFLNWAWATGWQGWGGQILFIDFIVFYSAGLLFQQAPESLYDFGAQLSLQQSLLAPTPLVGTGPFSHPPYVAPVVGVFSYLPLDAALTIWTALSVAALVGSIILTKRLFGELLTRLGISTGTLGAITLSLAPTVAGLYSGQMHTFALLGTLGVVRLVLRQRPWIAGIVAGLLAVKPQLALGFGLFFLARGDLRACAAALVSFVGLNAILVGAAGWTTAALLYSEYLKTTGSLLSVPFQAGFPAYLLMTPYGFLTGLTGIDQRATALFISTLVAGAFLVWFVHDAWRLRASEGAATPLLLGRAILLPFVLTPYWMMYDAASLLLAWPLVASGAETVLLAGGGLIYGWFWVFPVLSGAIGVPLGMLAAVGLWIYSERQYRSLRSTSFVTLRRPDVEFIGRGSVV